LILSASAVARSPAPGRVGAPRPRVRALTGHPKRRIARRTGSRRRRIGGAPGSWRRSPWRVFLARPAGEGVLHRGERRPRCRPGGRQPGAATTTRPMFLCPQRIPAALASVPRIDDHSGASAPQVEASTRQWVSQRTAAVGWNSRRSRARSGSRVHRSPVTLTDHPGLASGNQRGASQTTPGRTGAAFGQNGLVRTPSRG
jgi:hypothetical protein